MRTHAVVFALLVNCVPAAALALQGGGRADAQAPQGVLVPRVTGLPLAAAQKIISGANLAPSARSVSGVDPSPQDTVVRQDPPAGQTVNVKSTVILYVRPAVAPTPDVATVPRVVDLSLAAASQSLSAARIALGRVDSTDSPTAAGTVLSQSIAPGTRVPRNTKVDVTLARPPMFAMPVLVGRTLASARAIIGRSGLVLGRLDIAKVEGRPDTVVDQSPSPGTRVRRGDSITIVGGRAIAQVVVPNVVGSGTNAARVVLGNLGLALVPGRSTESASPAGTIITQSPGAGTSVFRGTSVSVDTAVPRLISVPNFVGTRIDRAASLPDAGLLRLVPHYNAPQPAAVDSVVVDQSPKPNARVPVGTTIDLTISQRQAARLDSLRIVPDSASLFAGDSVRMRARRFMSDGSSSDVVPTWTASAGAITTDGLYTAGSAPGRVTITASSSGVSGTAVIRVEQRQTAPSQPVPSQPVPSQPVPGQPVPGQPVTGQPVPSPPSALPPRTTTPPSAVGPTTSAPTGQSPPTSHVPWWLIAIGGAGVLGLGWGIWRHFQKPEPPTRATTRQPEPASRAPQSSPSPPPLNFTYDYKAQEPKVELTAQQGHGSEISLVSYPGESTHAIEPASVKLLD